MWNTLDEIGSLFKESRTSAGVSLEEASQDTSIPLTALEQIEEGSIGSFKDIFKLKEYLESYAKYLGLNGDEIIKTFNEYMFEYTSKIPASKLEKAIEEKEKQEEIELSETNEIKVMSPYLKPKENNNVQKYIILTIVIIVLIAIALIWAIKQVEG